MAKKIILGLVIVLLLGALAAWYFISQIASSPDADKNPVVSTMKDALVKSVSLTCEYTDEQGHQSKTYVKNGVIRSDSTGASAQDAASVIVNNKKMYLWNPSTKQGFTMTIPEEGQMPTQGLPPQAMMQAEDVVSGLEQNKDACKPSMVGDDLFTPPSDVKFSDYSDMMQQAPQNSQGKPGQNGQMTEEEMKQYLEQYQKQQQ